ncbi:MAG: CocE/NonD family hydrolase, partial [Bacteroidota bacterium]
MKSIIRVFALVLILGTFLQSCKKTAKTEVVEENYVAKNYTKREVDVEMRDGVKLHTTIYSPKDTSQEYPILMQRTPYSSRPYGEGEYRTQIGPNIHLMEEGNIIVYQDVRGRWMSEGHYDNMRAYIPNKQSN